MNDREHDLFHVGRDFYAKMKLLRIMDDKIAELIKRRRELHKELIKDYERHFKIKGG